MTRTSSATAALCLTLALGGCSSSTEPVRPAPGIVTVDITTAVQAAQSTIAPGSAVDLTLSVTNNGASTVRFEFRSTCQLVYAVYDENETRVSGAFPCGAALTSMTLEPGETLQTTSQWRAERYDPYSGTSPLPPGEYRIKASLMQHGFPSQPVTVRVE